MFQYFLFFVWRRHPDSNRGSEFCRLVPYHLAISPYTILYDNNKKILLKSLKTREISNWSGKRGSNPRPLPWQGSALSTELFPQNIAKTVHSRLL